MARYLASLARATALDPSYSVPVHVPLYLHLLDLTPPVHPITFVCPFRRDFQLDGHHLDTFSSCCVNLKLLVTDGVPKGRNLSELSRPHVQQPWNKSGARCSPVHAMGLLTPHLTLHGPESSLHLALYSPADLSVELVFPSHHLPLASHLQAYRLRAS